MNNEQSLLKQLEVELEKLTKCKLLNNKKSRQNIKLYNFKKAI